MAVTAVSPLSLADLASIHRYLLVLYSLLPGSDFELVLLPEAEVSLVVELLLLLINFFQLT